jgi:hypothetical protein
MFPLDDPPRVGPGDWPDILASLCGELYENVLRAWRQARDRRATDLWHAVGALAIDARTRGIPVSDVLRALNAVIDPRLGGDPALDWDHLREHAGKVVIANYYREDDAGGVMLLQPPPPAPGSGPMHSLRHGDAAGTGTAA